MKAHLNAYILFARITFVLLMLVGFAAQTQPNGQQLVTYTLRPPDSASPSKPFAIEVELAVEDGWYIYAPTGTNAAQGMIETKVVFSFPDGITRAGKMEIPQTLFKNGYEVLEGKGVLIRQSLNADRPGEYKIAGRITWQACSVDVCLQPVTEAFTTDLHVK